MLYELRGEHRAKSYLLNQLKECANSICLFKMLKTARTCKNQKNARTCETPNCNK